MFPLSFFSFVPLDFSMQNWWGDADDSLSRWRECVSCCLEEQFSQSAPPLRASLCAGNSGRVLKCCFGLIFCRKEPCGLLHWYSCKALLEMPLCVTDILSFNGEHYLQQHYSSLITEVPLLWAPHSTVWIFTAPVRCHLMFVIETDSLFRFCICTGCLISVPDGATAGVSTVQVWKSSLIGVRLVCSVLELWLHKELCGYSCSKMKMATKWQEKKMLFFFGKNHKQKLTSHHKYWRQWRSFLTSKALSYMLAAGHKVWRD